ncbi:MAG: InlB B-repeat-containing protein, partial [Bacteroidales bacterium]|nr:InlB B-repeat-containing protein [Bacteroidales bacterium]
EVQVSASASEGFTFVSWTLDGAEISGAANFTYTMPAEDVTLVANFEEIVVEPETFMLTLEASPTGAGTLNGDGEYEEGEMVLVEAVASEGYYFLNWTWNEMTVSASEQFMFTMPAEAVTLVAHFMKEVLPGFCTFSQGYWFAKPDVVWPFDVVIGGRTFTQEEGQDFWPSNTPLTRAFTQYAAVVLSEVIVSEFPDLLAAMQVIDHYFATTYPRNPNGNVNKASGFIGKWITENLCYEEIEISEAEYHEPASGVLLHNRNDQSILSVFPNPFRDKLTFRFAPAADTQVRLELFDMTGALVEVVYEGLVEANQLVEVQYHPRLRNTSFLFYRLTMGDELQTGKVMYQK